MIMTKAMYDIKLILDFIKAQGNSGDKDFILALCDKAKTELKICGCSDREIGKLIRKIIQDS